MLTGFQIRAARAALSLHIKEISNSIGIHYSTLTRLESKTSNLAYINCNTRTSLLLTNFYQNHGFVFSQFNSIELKCTVDVLKQTTNISRFQLKVSRIALRYSRKQLGNILGIPETNIAGWETGGDMLSTFSPHDSNIINNIKSYFINSGIIFPSFNTVIIQDDPVNKN